MEMTYEEYQTYVLQNMNTVDGFSSSCVACTVVGSAGAVVVVSGTVVVVGEVVVVVVVVVVDSCWLLLSALPSPQPISPASMITASDTAIIDFLLKVMDITSFLYMVSFLPPSPLC